MSSYNKYFSHFVSDMPGIYDYEFIEDATGIKEYHKQLVESAKQLGDAMYESYSEWYHVSDYSHLYDDFNEEELILSDIYKEKDIDDFKIIWSIIINRMEHTSSLINNGQGSLKDIELWVGLYNSYNETSLWDINEKPLLYLFIGDIKTFPPYFIDYLLNNIESQYCKHYYALLKPFTKRLKEIQNLVNSDAWPKSDIHKGFFIEWTIIFMELINKYDN